MSLDFPVREHWLRIRNTPQKRRVRWFHVSTHFGPVRDPETGIVSWVQLRKGTTYRRKP